MIYFEGIKWKNLLSTGNTFTEIQLNRSSNTLIVGTNGAGKSTILDALCFVLFGKPFRKINKPNLLNSINGNNCVVEIEFSSGQRKYKVVRGIKPNIFEIYCDGDLINQDAKAKDYQDYLERSILKLNYKSFTQVVILGSASFVPFMQLSAADRRAIIEDLLDIQIFSSMNVLVKEKLSSIKDSSMKLKYDMDLTAEKIKLQKHNIEEHKKHNDEEILRKREEISESESKIDKLNSDITLIKKHIESLEHKIKDEVNVKSKNKKLLQMETKLETSISKIEKDVLFYNENDNCPTCKQFIESEFKNQQVEEKENKKLEILEGLKKITEEVSRNNSRIDEINRIWKSIVDHGTAVSEHNSTIRAVNDYISKLNKEIENLLDRKENLIDENSKLQELKEQLNEYVKNQQELSTEKQYYEYASSLLKDTGIKTKIIKQYLPIMNKLVNKYLSAMDFFVNFNINENFEETIKSRHRDDFSYANFSEGEKQKIDLALLFTWRQIAKLKNSTNTNLLILDEVFDSSLDASSVELLMNLINEFSNDTNVFVISHKGDQLFDRFRSIIKFEKRGNFSRIST
jgi:DNA repair exonuclease SbcCD ATPase subunit